MPRLMKCVNDAHYYVRAAIGRVPVTFQLTKEGQHRLIKAGLSHLDQFDWSILSDLIDCGWAYTGKSGVIAQLPPITGADLDPSTEQIDPGPPHRLERRVWLWLEGSDTGTLDAVVGRVTVQFQAAGGSVQGPYPLPTRSEVYKVLTSNGRKNYTIQTHKRTLVVIDPKPAVFVTVHSTELPAGISIRLRESVSVIEVVA